jgi:phytoene synthase
MLVVRASIRPKFDSSRDHAYFSDSLWTAVIRDGRMDGMDSSLPAAREMCRRMTRHHAKSFYFASHVLPRVKRGDAYAIYAFCRHVDDEIE